MIKNNDVTVPELFVAISNYLDCSCEYFPSMQSDAPLMEAYHKAIKRGRKEGFIPVFVVIDDFRGDNLDAEDINKKSATGEGAEPRQKLLSTTLEDGKAALNNLLKEYKEVMEEYGMSPDELEEMFGDEDMDLEELDEMLDMSELELAEMSDEMSGDDQSKSFYGLKNGDQTNPALLVEVPVKNPWEIFAYLPFGGWNECPDTETHMAVSKYWYEKYGAVPAVITMDTLEFLLPAPVSEEQAMELAKEQYVYCTDIVDQGIGEVHLLAKSLCQSKIWFFWWD